MRKKIDHQLKDFQVARGEGLTGKQPAVKTNIIPHPMVLLFSLQFFIKTASICMCFDFDAKYQKSILEVLF